MPDQRFPHGSVLVYGTEQLLESTILSDKGLGQLHRTFLPEGCLLVQGVQR